VVFSLLSARHLRLESIVREAVATGGNAETKNWRHFGKHGDRKCSSEISGAGFISFLWRDGIFSRRAGYCANHECGLSFLRVMSQSIPRTLSALRRAEIQCTRCPLYEKATQVVPGEGPQPARLMMVGEQPGNDEDLAGRPFIGPAGRILDRAITDAGLDRSSIFITNAVKHFKFEIRGKRRLHKRPDNYEIERCKWWNDIEQRLVKPELIIALGATAARSLTGKAIAIQKLRGNLLALGEGRKLVITAHPSSLLRIPDRDERHHQYEAFVDDLRRSARYLGTA
jgi:uracil-DNA glycosylase